MLAFLAAEPSDPIGSIAPTAGLADFSGAGLELTVVVPTFNERGNVARLVDRLDAVLAGVVWQVIFVDDNSPDGTADAVKRIAVLDRRVQCLRRMNRRGLAGAVIEGVMASPAPYVAVMDGDLQHDESLLPSMLAALREDRADLVIGSRFMTPDLPDVRALGVRRQLGSRLANWLGRRALSADLTDPVSGYFMIRRPLIDAVAPRLNSEGFKVLFDILASQASPPRCLELPYAFRPRTSGASKLDSGVITHYLSLLASKLSHDILSPRVLMFCLVGAAGVVVHLAVLRAMLGVGFVGAQIIAAQTAMTSNYLVNNAITYRDRRKRGLALLTGYLKFCLFCSVGLAANVAVASMLHERLPIWWAADLTGAGVGAAWNFATTSVAVW
ncbi:glycosyltransferase family 2 protein [soil metagenome]